jgi:hypothetical protein
MKIQSNVEFLRWLVGFFEGDGYLGIAKRGDLCFVISQKEKYVLELIKERLGFGKIVKQSLNVFRYVVQSQKELYEIILILNGQLLLEKRQKQFMLFLEAYNKKYKTNIVYNTNLIYLSLNDSWLTGFIDAEGCFSVTFLSKPYAVRIRFLISQKNDKKIMNDILSLFKKGQIEYHSPSNSYSYVLSGLKNVNSIFSYLEQYSLLTKKKESFIKWKYIYSCLKNKDHLNKEKRQFLMKLANKINRE